MPISQSSVERAIERAIKAGYDCLDKRHMEEGYTVHGEDMCNEYRILLDPLFWVSLGKAEGWEKYEDEISLNTTLRHHWLEQWHRFIDHLAIGGVPETFFASLLKNHV